METKYREKVNIHEKSSNRIRFNKKDKRKKPSLKIARLDLILYSTVKFISLF